MNCLVGTSIEKGKTILKCPINIQLRVYTMVLEGVD